MQEYDALRRQGIDPYAAPQSPGSNYNQSLVSNMQMASMAGDATGIPSQPLRQSAAYLTTTGYALQPLQQGAVGSLGAIINAPGNAVQTVVDAAGNAAQVIVDTGGNVVGVINQLNPLVASASDVTHQNDINFGVPPQPVASPVPPTPVARVGAPSTSYMNVVQPASVGYVSPTVQYPSIGSLQTQANYAPMTTGRTPIMDGSTTVGYTEQLSNGSQKVYYVVAGYPKSGMPKAGTYSKGQTIPRARKQGYNRQKKKVLRAQQKKVKTLIQMQATRARRWL